MALKDITLGQYFPGNTFVHRLDPRVKLIFTVCYIIALFLAKSLIGYGVMIAILVLSIAISRIKPKALFKGMKPVLFLVAITGLLNLFYTSGDPIWQWGFLKITVEGIWAAIFMILRIVLLICCTFLLTYTTSPIMLTDGLENLLSPLKKIKPLRTLSVI